MKKKVVVVLILIQLFMLFLFQNLYVLFRELENFDQTDPVTRTGLVDHIRQMKKVFSILSILLGIFLAASGIYLGVIYRKSRSEVKLKNISPLQDYLLELKGSEIELKGMVEKQQEHAVWREELNRSIINNINSAIIFINQFDKIDIINSGGEELFGQSYAHAKNNTLETIVRGFPELVHFIRSHQNRRISDEVRSGGSVFMVDLIPIQKMGLLVMIRDITEEKQREEIERKNQNFVMLGEMTAALTHEVRNSLGVILGYVKSMKSETEGSGKRPMTVKIDRVTREIEFLSATMESFLSFSKPIIRKKMEKIDLIQYLRKIAEEKKIKLLISPDEMFFETDPVLMTAVFSNLVLNAVEAGADRITVEFGTENRMEILFSDNGSGIDPDIRDKIWLPLFTTKEKGTGMGLAIVRKMVNTLKGEIQLEDSSSEGAAFRIMFY